MRSRLPLLVLATVLALSFTACEDEPEPKIADPTSAPTTTASPPPISSPPPTTPMTTAPPKRESAKAFIRRWQALAEDMIHSGDGEAYLNLTRRCRACESFVADTEQLYKDGGSITGGLTRVSGIKQVGKIGSVIIFEYVLHSTPSTVTRPDVGPEQLKGGKSAFQVNLVRDGSSWVVMRISGIPL